MKTDIELKKDVLDELDFEPAVMDGVIIPGGNPEIGVIAADGVVTLEGVVDSYARKWAASRGARRVAGVKEVVDNIKVKLPDSTKLTDEEIGREAMHAIDLNVSVPQGRINVKVEDGSITLTGEVDWSYQREAAKQEVYQLRGAVLVNDMITIKPVEPGDIKNKIESAFRRNALLDSNRIGVEINGGKAILKGNVCSWAEKEEVLRIVWAARGVSQIDDHILIS